MGKYTVEVETRAMAVYEVEADSAKEAESKWSAGEARYVRTYETDVYDTHVTEGWETDDDSEG